MVDERKLNATLYADSTPLVNGTTVGDITGNITTKYYFNYADNPANGDVNGKLYTYAAAMNGAASDTNMLGTTQGVCPTSWHLPTHHEYTTLERAVCASGTCTTDFPYDFSTIGWIGTDEGSRLAGNAALWTNGALDESDFGTNGLALRGATATTRYILQCWRQRLLVVGF